MNFALYVGWLVYMYAETQIPRDFTLRLNHSAHHVQWRNMAFYGLVASLVFHNVLSALHGTRSLFHAHQVKPLKMLDQTWWRYLVIAAHLVGFGNIMIPLTLIFSSSDMSEAQFKER